MGELSPFLICFMVAWVEESCLLPFSPMPEACGRNSPEVIGAGELILPFRICSIWESDPYATLSNTVELALKV